MAKVPKIEKPDDETIEAVDLLTLLTPPGCDNWYKSEIVAPESDEDYDLLAIAANLPDVFDPVSDKKTITSFSSSYSIENHPCPTAKLQKKEENLESLLTSLKKTARPVKTELLSKIKIENDSFELIIKEIAECTRCDLHKTRKKTVPGIGSEKAKLVFIGEAPGADEDMSGIPFVGIAGKHLDKILAATGFKKKDIYICNILKCRPPGNRDPLLSEMVCCTPFLQRQLHLLQPSLIACLGNVAVRYVVGSKTPGITRIHGQWFDSIFSIPAMAMYHPSYLIRSDSREKGSPNWQMWQDIQALKKRYDSSL